MNPSAFWNLVKERGHARADTRRNQRIVWAWGTSLGSKFFTLAVQGLSLPIVYRSLGAESYAAYAAVTSVASIMAALNLGMGAALVTPVAQAAARDDHEDEASLFGAVFLPLCALAAVAGMIGLPLLAALPMSTVFGTAAATTPANELRAATLIAFAGSLLAVPLSAFGNLRQAYQELHVDNLIGIARNGVLCVALIAAWWAGPTLLAFVMIMVLVPLGAHLVNGIALARKRPYLFSMLISTFSWQRTRYLAPDGIAYLGAQFSYLLLFKWPIYYLARTQPPAMSSSFAVIVQIVLLANSLRGRVVAPLWGATADARGAGDSCWLRRTLRLTRIFAIAFGLCALLFFVSLADRLIPLWLGESIQLAPWVAFLMGLYILLSTWEYSHLMIVLGLGAMKHASAVVLLRGVLFAASVPLIANLGPAALLSSLCLSILLTTAWYHPFLVQRRLGAHTC